MTFDLTAYHQYLGSDEWQAKRAEYYAAHQHPDCYCCNTPWTRFFELHHRTYDRLYHERLDDLVPVCRSCHGYIHRLEKKLRRGKNKVTLWQATDIARRRRRIRKWALSVVGAVAAICIGVVLAVLSTRF